MLKKLFISAVLLLGATGAWAAPSVLSLNHTVPDSTIIYPESVETDVHKMMENWYLQTYAALDKEVENRPDVEVSDEELTARLAAMPTVIEMPFNSVVKNYINMYTGKKRSLVETMLGMSLYYMPIFEEAIEREGIPMELKYLPIIESALNPDAVSRAGATGLWQLMLPTARGLGLEINSLVDERRDPIRSSQAATRYLRELYDIYKDWSLAVAAYNCGPGNVNKALRRCTEERKDFWTIYPYLPAETRGYVPCFIAATYVMNYYNKHNISPALAKKPILTDSVHVSRRIHFNQISDILHIPVEELQILNPQYRQQIIPGDVAPASLVLPAGQIYAYILSEDAIAAHDADLYGRRLTVEPSDGSTAEPATVDGQEGEWVTKEQVKYHQVRRNETLSSIARKYGITLGALKRANGNPKKARRGQRLKIVTTTKEFRPYPAKDTEQQETPATDRQPDELLVRNEEEPKPEAEEAADVVVAEAEEAAVAETENPEPEETDEAEAPDAEQDDEEEAEAEVQVAANNATTAPAAAPSEASSKVASSFQASKEKKQEAEAKQATKKEAAKPAPKKDNVQYHKVRSGETLAKIAKRNGTTVAKLQKLNPKINPSKIKPGDRIRIK